MLTETFCHVPGIGRKTERSLWKQGCRDWAILLDEFDSFSLGTASRTLARSTIEQSQRALARGEHQYFRKRLRMTDAWRAWPEFRHSCVYLDIETDGRSHTDCVTMIGMYDGERFECLVKGEDLASFPDRISHYSMIVTFFGSGFDLPVLQRRFPQAVFDHVHLDLCPTLRRLGYRGGLKKIEKELGITREDDVDGLTGWDAVLLWRRHLAGSDTALERLIAYNREDVVNLERLTEIAYGQMRRETVGEQLRLF